jgi:hypothetical protein
VESPALIHDPAKREQGPPPGLEKFVTYLLPPAARESVAGDLCELYESPGQFAFAALRVIPFIVASQIRRSANLPLLVLQGLLLLDWLYGVGGALMPAAWGTAVILFGLAVLEAYRGSGRPSVEGAIVTAVAAGAAAELGALVVARILKVDIQTIPYFAFFGPVMVPVLCLVRTAVMLWHDRFRPCVTGKMSGAALAREYESFRRRSAWQCRAEAAILVVIAMLLGHGLIAVSVFYLLAALYLVWDGEARAVPAGVSDSGLRLLFRDALARQHRLRSLVWWLWFAPLFLTMQSGLGARPPLAILQGLAAALLCGFFIGALNRERRGQVQEEIGSLTPGRSRSL